MENKKLINEISRIQEMMGVNLITERGLGKIVDKQVARFFEDLLPSVEKLAKTGEKALDNEIMQDVATTFNKELESKAGMPYSKKLNSLKINTLEDLANNAAKFSEKEFKEISSYILTKSLKEIESTGKLASLIDDNVFKSLEFSPTRNLLDYATSIPEKIGSDSIDDATSLLNDLKTLRNGVSDYGLSEDGVKKLTSEIDDIIAELEGKIQKTLEPDFGKGAADAGAKIGAETVEEAIEESSIIGEMSDFLDGLEKTPKGYVVPKKRVLALLESKGITGSKANKILSIIEKASVKSDQEMMTVFKNAVETSLRKEGAGIEVINKFMTKFESAKDAFSKLGFAGKVVFWIATDLLVASSAQGLMYILALDKTFPTVYGIFQILGFKLGPGINTIRQSMIDTADEVKQDGSQNNSNSSTPNNNNSNTTTTPEASESDFKKWYDEEFPGYIDKLTSYEVDGSDKTLVIVKGKNSQGVEQKLKYKKQSDGTYKIQK